MSNLLTCMRAYILCTHIHLYTDRFVRIHIKVPGAGDHRSRKDIITCTRVYIVSMREISTVTDQIWRYRDRQTTEAVTDARVYNVLVALDTLSPHCSVPGTIPYISTPSSIYCSVPGHNIVHQYFIIYILLCRHKLSANSNTESSIDAFSIRTQCRGSSCSLHGTRYIH